MGKVDTIVAGGIVPAAVEVKDVGLRVACA